jgi:hypothetical protein
MQYTQTTIQLGLQNLLCITCLWQTSKIHDAQASGQLQKQRPHGYNQLLFIMVEAFTYDDHSYHTYINKKTTLMT